MVAAALVLGSSPGESQAPAAPPTPDAVLGAAGFNTTRLMGAVTQGGEPGEVWGYQMLPAQITGVRVDGEPLEFGPRIQGDEQQLALMRYTDASGWQVAQTPLDAAGHPWRGPLPLPAATPVPARMTPRGGAVLLGRDQASPAEFAALHRNPGRRFRQIVAPPELLAPNERLASLTRAPFAVFQEGTAAGALFVPVGRAAEDTVLHYDGQGGWSGEQVCAPRAAAEPPTPEDECPAFESGESFRAISLAATGPDNAWLLAEPDDSLGRGVVLYERVFFGAERRWIERELGPGGARFATAEDVAAGLTEIGPLTSRADPLTATTTGLWIDGRLLAAGARSDFTLHVAVDGLAVTSFCDAPGVCDRPLGASFTTLGYTSQAWAGPGLGTRVLTNMAEPGGGIDTIRGTYLRFDGTAFERRPGGARQAPTAAFTSLDEGWLQGPVHITSTPLPERLASWPVPLRRPLTAVAGEPGRSPGDLGAGALAVGADGSVARYTPGGGWDTEFLLGANGNVAKPVLRGVAWPEPKRAHAVGDRGAMWEWRAETGFWERDPATPLNFDANLLDVAFQPGNDVRGYAVGRAGALLAYGKTWEQEPLPAEFAGRDFTKVAFAGSQALVAAGSDLLVNDGAGWRADEGVRELFAGVPAAPRLWAVAGLPDGGAVAAGDGVVIERDAARGPWRLSDQPLPAQFVSAVAAFREGGRVRAVVSVLPADDRYPPEENVLQPDPNLPPPLVPTIPLIEDGYVLRETSGGWRDEQQQAFGNPGPDKPLKPDAIAAFLLDASGAGWAVGGQSGRPDSAERGSENQQQRAIVQTGGIYRYSAGSPEGPPAAGRSAVALPGGVVRFAVGGHAQCEAPCTDLAPLRLAPDRTVTAALDRSAELASTPNGPRFFLYTGGRLPETPGASISPREARRYATLLQPRGRLATYPALSAGDTGAGEASAFMSAFSFFSAPFGDGPAPAGVSADTVPGLRPGPGQARTHYAFDSEGPSGRLRVVVIDNSRGSLASSDPYQNPAEPQLPWLITVLDDARARGIPTIVMGSRDLNPRFTPTLNPAEDGQAVAEVLRDHGASAYFFERPEENRITEIPAGSEVTIPSFGTGTLGYRSDVEAGSSTRPLLDFGEAGFLLAEVNTEQRDPITNRAPVGVRLIPAIEEISLEAVDGVVLRRSRQALFRGLGRRPRSGDRWGGQPESRQPAGSDPYIALPPPLCRVGGCSTKVNPEYSFSSSDPSVGDFVRQDPNSNNPRKPFLDSNNRVVSDSSSGLFCAFNPGETTVAVASGGLSYSRTVRVLGGSVLRPCGTRPASRRPSIVRPVAPPATPTSPPPPPPGPTPPVEVTPPPPPPPEVTPVSPPPAPEVPSPRPPAPPPAPPAPIVFTTPPAPTPVPVLPLPPNPLTARPTPPGGAIARVFQVEEKREEEVAPEESRAFARYEPEDEGPGPVALLPALILLAAFAGAGVRGRPRSGPRRAAPAPAASARRARR